MPIANAQISDGATSIAPTGGTTITLASLGINGDISSVYVSTDTSIKTRRTIDFSKKNAKVNASSKGGFTQPRSKAKMNFPRTLADGSVTYDTVTIELARDISATDADVANYMKIAAQVCFDSDFDAFWKAQSLA